jgi:enoyl-CoA hydratase/carnithine racemase
MGGGAGISVHGAFRVATEKTMFAMPETNIGLFPDVGASFFLSALPGSLGSYLALTGARLGAADVLYTGLATHYVPSSFIPELIRKLEACDSAAAVREACDSLAADPGTPPLAAVRPTIDRCFGNDSVEEILAALQGMPESDWAQDTLGGLSKMSPTSCKVQRTMTAKAMHHTLRGAYIGRATAYARPHAHPAILA